MSDRPLTPDLEESKAYVRDYIDSCDPDCNICVYLRRVVDEVDRLTEENAVLNGRVMYFSHLEFKADLERDKERVGREQAEQERDAYREALQDEFSIPPRFRGRRQARPRSAGAGKPRMSVNSRLKGGIVTSWLEYRDFAINILGFSEREAEEYANKRVAEDLNRERNPDFKDAA